MIHTPFQSVLSMIVKGLYSRNLTIFRSFIRHASSDEHQNTMKHSNEQGMDWATRAFLGLIATLSIGYGWYRHDNYYASKGMVHPITAWITKNLYIETNDRERRIQSMDYHSAKAAERMKENSLTWSWIKE